MLRPTASQSLLLDMTEETIMRGCIVLVENAGRSFRLVEDSGFRLVIDPVLKALGNKRAISAAVVKDRLREDARLMREGIGYMDPRYCHLLTPEQKYRATLHLTKTWRRITDLQGEQDSTLSSNLRRRLQKIRKTPYLWIEVFSGTQCSPKEALQLYKFIGRKGRAQNVDSRPVFSKSRSNEFRIIPILPESPPGRAQPSGLDGLDAGGRRISSLFRASVN
ncbi:hypothetical protein HPB47_002865 [Ixodes persulcatus]|uniref:Uncharacterized protein n=1 Tax=Ixodes persulcatus TaxID=34615 RepID=A0AC60QZM1_IXOPE|nr:hypothetical protein HPB47_002865 [Ixodes persulcatus]